MARSHDSWERIARLISVWLIARMLRIIRR
jgi:hypothetical protein